MTVSRFNFRCWDKEENIMCYEAQNTYDYIKGYPNIMANCFGELIDSEKYILMQSTGLVDRNGKEIFEGDIISKKANYFYAYRHKEDREIVEWFDDDITGFYPFNSYDLETNTYNVPKDFEVIGNIFENKDLLKN